MAKSVKWLVNWVASDFTNAGVIIEVHYSYRLLSSVKED